MEWALILADLPPRVRQEVEAMQNVIDLWREQVAQLERERDEAQSKARQCWGTMKLYIRSQRCFTEAQNEERIARVIGECPWLEEESPPE